MAEIQEATDVGFPEELNIMFFGQPGGGKTTFATTFPRPILFFDIDQRHQTYAGVDGVDYLEYKEEGSKAFAYRDFIRDLRKYQTGSDYKTVCVDSTTMLLRLIKNDLLGLRGTGKGATEGLSLPQWGTVTDRFEKVFDIVRNYDTHSIVTSHEQAFQDELTGEIMRVVMMVGKKFPQKAPLFFDEIYYCYRKEGKGDKKPRFLFRTQNSRRHFSRTSLNVHDKENNTVPILDEVEVQHFRYIKDKVEEARKDPAAYAKKMKAKRRKSSTSS